MNFSLFGFFFCVRETKSFKNLDLISFLLSQRLGWTKEGDNNAQKRALLFIIRAKHKISFPPRNFEKKHQDFAHTCRRSSVAAPSGKGRSPSPCPTVELNQNGEEEEDEEDQCNSASATLLNDTQTTTITTTTTENG